jgi:hypothetical protein
MTLHTSWGAVRIRAAQIIAASTAFASDFSTETRSRSGIDRFEGRGGNPTTERSLERPRDGDRQVISPVSRDDLDAEGQAALIDP